MNQPQAPQNAAVTREMDLTTPNLVASGQSSSVFHKTQANTFLHDVRPAAGTAVIGIYAGKREINRAPGQSWAEALAGGAPIPSGQSITAIVQNLTSEPLIARATFVVEEEAVVLPADAPGAPQVAVAPQAVQPQKQFGFGADRPGVRTVTSGQAPANTPFVRRTGGAPNAQQPQGAGHQKQSTETVQNADGTTRKVVRTVLPPIAQRSPEVAAQIRAAGGNPNTGGNRGGGGGARATNAPRRSQTVRASGKAPARVNPPRFHGSAGGSARSSMPVEANGRTRVVRNGSPQIAQNVSPSGMPTSGAANGAANLVQGRSTAAHATRTTAPSAGLRTFVVMPADGEFTFALIVGHAERLLLRVESNVALPKMFKPSLTRALATASNHPRTAGGNDVVICVPQDDLITLRQLIIAGGMPLDVETRTRIGRAIRRGLAVVRGDVEVSTTNVAALAPIEESLAVVENDASAVENEATSEAQA